MRKLVLSIGVSLDGLVARPGRFGAGDWGLRPRIQRSSNASSAGCRTSTFT
jgi:hypothetical protein